MLCYSVNAVCGDDATEEWGRRRGQHSWVSNKVQDKDTHLPLRRLGSGTPRTFNLKSRLPEPEVSAQPERRSEYHSAKTHYHRVHVLFFNLHRSVLPLHIEG